jgi:hypothetical protein
MAKELPYFKFEPNQWENGNVQICSREDKGLFLDLCSMYWSRLGKVPFKLAVQKLCNGNATAFDSLINEGIFTVIEDDICIEFLNEQLQEFEDQSEINRKNALEGWKKRRESERNATASKPQSETDGIREEKSKEEKSKEEKSKEEKKKTFMSKAIASDLTELNVPFFEIAKAFFDLFEKNANDLGVEWLHLKKITADSFTDSIRLMSTVDNRSVNDIRAVWEFLKKDEFWKPNIQSSKKLREKFDQLITKAKTNGNSKTGNGFVEQAHAYFSANDPNYKNL